MAEVNLGGVLSDEELVPYLLVREPVGYELEYLALTPGQKLAARRLTCVGFYMTSERSAYRSAYWRSEAR